MKGTLRLTGKVEGCCRTIERENRATAEKKKKQCLIYVMQLWIKMNKWEPQQPVMVLLL